ncbi:hypothetical protein PHYBLDRAFT_149626 [Phycomyces blakesleeanus NRRL 1555(-)]|uniref:FHA domain-containing protein n=1 Tax=Phycomyces blakesleeanus (strain ATCC 8743b / DSM 1359 / FGSC 10004 / NBRC 33097 / NRRL 1555) TaxID=763407 RepID=A0A162TRM8_PHYB8|nr:hypothetical protein PHYBLDRAFT_149626 [Phycomyces blakesleeanus NRRL 1555(-)]OAD69223.1 hypothetical protein PHYBLDRAFT_149626 [Phycomyces blakesleeanus NRRL 1555(-)]|eukprot:XP_018287263.1 hypothetical protein PHYBLDRAFT_149626 [Phycomyces blakesleeanus NRRL 1555(-)]
MFIPLVSYPLFPVKDSSRKQKCCVILSEIPSPKNHKFEIISREVIDGQSLVLGRFDNKNVKRHAFIGFQSPSVSQFHAKILAKKGKLYIKDIKSSLGTFLNGYRLSQSFQESSRYPLRDNDILQLGQVSENDGIDTNKPVLMKLRIRQRTNAWNYHGDL